MADAPDVSVEATGETVGEAKWAALRELEKRQPGVDKGTVRFEVVSEGERGLLGVGYAPARVVASARAVEAPPRFERTSARADSVPREDESEFASLVRGLVERIADAIGAECGVVAEETDETLTVTCSGDEPGMLIGRHGQTIDSIQYLVNAIAYRRFPEDRKEVVVDAAGYRARRRRTLEELAVQSADRALAEGNAVALEAMTAVERKIVHLRLKDYPGVGTTSEGTEPNRFVVVAPE